MRTGDTARKGKIFADGKPGEIIDDYFTNANTQSSIVDLSDQSLRRNSLDNSAIKWQSMTLLNSANEPTDHLGFLEPFSLELIMSVTKKVSELRLAFAVQSALGFALFNSVQYESKLPTTYTQGVYRFKITILKTHCSRTV